MSILPQGPQPTLPNPPKVSYIWSPQNLNHTMKLKQWLAHGWLAEKKSRKKKKKTQPIPEATRWRQKKMVAVDGMAAGDSGSGFITSPFSFCQLRRPNVSLSPSLSRGSTLGYLMILKFTMRCTCILSVFWRETSRNSDHDTT